MSGYLANGIAQPAPVRRPQYVPGPQNSVGVTAGMAGSPTAAQYGANPSLAGYLGRQWDERPIDPAFVSSTTYRAR
ncbi:MAG: hypothetical protein AB7O56_09530 [Bauldia sp.]